ncbi:MAG TPA: bifunctional oligoribonuclease/PAP phosphatase NrnA [Thermodesulfovibrionia bacterium]|nr:bifunctional oligoribonuclease/PAP phosphatase NrnA [Thermodesulfovibrionia bacterium]
MVPEAIVNILKESGSFVIASHINPEGDAIGSTLALGLGLLKAGKRVYLYNKDGVPESLRFLPFSELITSELPDESFEVLIIVDCGSLKRIGTDKINCKSFAIVDHHLPDSDISAAKWIVPEAAATGELVFKILKHLNVDIDQAIAENLYTSILTDTGSLRYPNTTSETLRIMAELMETGINTWDINRTIYENVPLRRLKLLGASLATLQIDGSIGWITVTDEMYKATGSKAEDTEELANIPRKVHGVEVAIFFRQKDASTFKISLRSKDQVNVAAIARQFGGGGHFHAAGCTVEGNLEDIQLQLIMAVKNALKELSN